MKRIHFFIVSLCMVCCLYGQKKSKGIYVEIPYEFNNELNSPVVEATIKGITYRLLVDTGSPITLITRRVVDGASLHISDELMVARDIHGMEVEQPLAVVEGMSLGDLPVKKIKGLVCDNEFPFFRCNHIDGMIGGDVLKRYVVKFDNRAKVMTLTNKASRFIQGKQEWQKVIVGFSKPYCKVNFNREKAIGLLFDTGNQFPRLLLDSATYQWCKKEQLFEFMHEEEGYGCEIRGLHSQRVYTKEYRAVIKELNFGGHILRNIPVQTAPVITLGFSLLNYGDVIIDYPCKRYCFIPNGNQWQDIRHKASCGVQDSDLIVTMLWDKELGKTVSVGDKIKQIGDRTFEHIEDCFNHKLIPLIQKYATTENNTIIFEKANGEKYSLPAAAFY